MADPRYAVAIQTVVVVASLSVLACGSLERTASQIVDRTVPVEVSRPYVSTERAPGYFRARWEFEMAGASEAYSDWVTPRLKPMFTKRSASDRKIVLSRQLEGDLQTITIDLERQNGNVHVRIAFSAIPW